VKARCNTRRPAQSGSFSSSCARPRGLNGGGHALGHIYRSLNEYTLLRCI